MISIATCSDCAGRFGETHVATEFLSFREFLSYGDGTATAKKTKCWLCDRREKFARVTAPENIERAILQTR
jgi:hypothetical protein